MSEVLYIVIPAYNEEENIENIVNDWYPVVVQRGNSASRLVIIDDGSKDNTRAILEKCRQSPLFWKYIPKSMAAMVRQYYTDINMR